MCKTLNCDDIVSSKHHTHTHTHTHTLSLSLSEPGLLWLTDCRHYVSEERSDVMDFNGCWLERWLGAGGHLTLNAIPRLRFPFNSGPCISISLCSKRRGTVRESWV